MDGLNGQYKDVRALARGIDIMEALADLGWVKPGTLATYVNLDRAPSTDWSARFPTKGMSCVARKTALLH